MPVLHNAALGPHAGYHATRAACRLPVPHACTLLDMAGVRSTRSTCPPRVLRCPANLAYKLPHEMQVPARGVRPPSFKYILLYLGGWILRRPEAPPAPVQAFEGEREVSGTLHARNLRGARGFSVVTGCSACAARGPLLGARGVSVVTGCGAQCLRCTRASACMGTVVLALHSGVLPAPPPPARAAEGGAAAEWPRSCTKRIGWHGGGAEWTKLSSSWCGIPGRLCGTAWPATEGWLLRTAQPGDELWRLLPVRQPGVGAGSRAYRAYGREGPASAVCHGCHCT